MDSNEMNEEILVQSLVHYEQHFEIEFFLKLEVKHDVIEHDKCIDYCWRNK
jgi:hypothetical protein